LNFVPIINIFTPFFAQIVMFHWIMEEKRAVGAAAVRTESKDRDG